jgi:5-oxoprolinase (ATP-hydrolysing) subunit C
VLELTAPSPFVALQGAPRFHLSHFGISSGGAADPVSFTLANLLVGNPSGTPAFEMTLRGGEFLIRKAGVLALTGSDFGATLDGEAVAPWQSFAVKVGQRLKVGSSRGGARAYLAHGSGRPRSTAFRVSFGPIRVLKGVDWDDFSSELVDRFFEREHLVTPLSNRNGIRLQSELPKIAVSEKLTEGVLWGTVQITPDGQPVILMNDQQTTGGYPKIAQVIRADRGLLGQLKPGQRISFVLVDEDRALEALRDQRRQMEESLT